jgi:hypothetical protein
MVECLSSKHKAPSLTPKYQKNKKQNTYSKNTATYLHIAGKILKVNAIFIFYFLFRQFSFLFNFELLSRIEEGEEAGHCGSRLSS